MIRLLPTKRSNFVGFFFEIFRRLKNAIPRALAISSTDSSSLLVNGSALFIEELEDAHQIFIVGDDRVGQDLFRLEAGAFIVGRIVKQGWMDALEFGDVVGVGNVHGAEIFGAETGEALFRNRDADFFDAVDVRNLGKDFFFFRDQMRRA